MCKNVVCLCIALAFVFTGQASAAVKTWIGNGASDWYAPGSWSDGVPGAADGFTANSDMTLVSGQNPTVLTSVKFGTAANPITVNIQNGASLTSTSATAANALYLAFVPGVNSNTILNVDGTLTLSSNIHTGYGNTGTSAGPFARGTINVGATGLVKTVTQTMGDLRLGSGVASGIGTVNVNGGTIDLANNLLVGVTGKGQFNMNSGAVTARSTLQIGYTGGQGGMVQLDGGTITANTLTFFSNGSMDITGGILKLKNLDLVRNAGLGDLTYLIEGYVGSGNLTGYGVNDLLRIHTSYDPGTMITTVWATPEPATLCLLAIGSLILRKRRA